MKINPIASCVVLLFVSPAAWNAAAGEKPAKNNVLFIIADDLNRSLPCYGHPVVKTPNVDRLATRAVRFDRAYCQYPVCSPSRVSFPSGRWPEQARMFGNEFELYAPEKLPLPIPGEVPRPGGDPQKPAASDDSRRAALRAYFACVSFMDRQLGRVLDTLDRLNLWDNTIVVMLGDNGYHLGTRSGYWGKGTPYEDSCGVPLLIAAPGKAKATGCRRVVEYVDFYPTLVDLCGLPARRDLEGRSLRPLLDDPAMPWDHAAFSVNARNDKPINLAVSTERFRYIEYADAKKSVQLYDIQADPREWTNLAAKPEHAETLAKLKPLAAEHRAKFWNEP